MEEQILALRKALAEEGLDAGAGETAEPLPQLVDLTVEALADLDARRVTAPPWQ